MPSGCEQRTLDDNTSFVYKQSKVMYQFCFKCELREYRSNKHNDYNC